jgi:hypothetical protein
MEPKILIGMGAVKKLLVHQLRDKQDYYKGLNKKKVILHNKREVFEKVII